jgi:peptide/nickel transport system permease protein
MLALIGRRLVWAVVLVLVVSFLVFWLAVFIPGDPATTLAGPGATPERVEEVRHRLGLDDRLPVRYVQWLGDAVQGDLGRSFYTDRPVTKELSDRWPVTVSLMVGATAVAVLFGVAAGMFAGCRPGSILDRATTVVATTGIAVPQFVVAVLLIVVFGIWLGVLPIGGYVKWADSPSGWARHLVLPVLALGAEIAAQLTRQVRSALATTLRQDYIRTARAKGLSGSVVVFKHGMRMAATPALQVVAVQVAYMLGGAVLVEQVFNLPGLGTLMINAIQNRDLPVIEGIVPLAVVVAVLVNLVADVAQAALDPRLREPALAGAAA